MLIAIAFRRRRMKAAAIVRVTGIEYDRLLKVVLLALMIALAQIVR